MLDWGSTFGTTLPLAELVVRGSVTFLAVLLLIRMVGQREPGALGITDVLVIVLVAQATAPGLYGEGTSVGDALVLVITILVWSIVVDALSYRWPHLGRFLKSRPKVLVDAGRANRKVMRRELMTEDELDSILRLHGVEDITKVRSARIEPNGMVSVLRTDDGDSETPEPPASIL